jgi:hypothetical protein
MACAWGNKPVAGLMFLMDFTQGVSMHASVWHMGSVIAHLTLTALVAVLALFGA